MDPFLQIFANYMIYMIFVFVWNLLIRMLMLILILT